MLKALFNQCDLETEYKGCQKYILYPSRFQWDELNGTARMEDVRKELKQSINQNIQI